MIRVIKVEQRLANLTVVRDTLQAALDAGCDDLVGCATMPCCPQPFDELARGEGRA